MTLWRLHSIPLPAQDVMLNIYDKTRHILFCGCGASFFTQHFIEMFCNSLYVTYGGLMHQIPTTIK
jgi:hypothetical protein